MMDDKNNELSERITQIGSKSIRELFEFQKQYAKKYRQNTGIRPADNMVFLF